MEQQVAVSMRPLLTKNLELHLMQVFSILPPAYAGFFSPVRPAQRVEQYPI